MKYIILKSYNDYDCGVSCAEIVNDIVYGSWQDIYDVIVKDILDYYGVSSLDEIEDDYELPDKNKVSSYTHKCGTAWLDTCDGQIFYDIQTIKVD